MATLTEQIENSVRLTNTPMKITMSTLIQINRDDFFIEGITDGNLDDKCDENTAIRMINIQEAKLQETDILPVNDKFKLDFANEYIPSPKDSKALEAKTRSKPFPMIKRQNKEINVKFFNMFLSSQHEFSKPILTLSKEFKNMTIREFLSSKQF